MPHKEKLGALRGVRQWQKLDSAGDVKRFLAWCIHSVRDKSLDPKAAAIMGQLGSFLLKAVEVADLEDRMGKIERSLNEERNGSASHTPTAH
jgi:hypothetical protein